MVGYVSRQLLSHHCMDTFSPLDELRLPVYYVANDCCDWYNYLLGSRCNVICAPDGGHGGGDGRCPEFRKEATFMDIVWCYTKSMCDYLEDHYR
jgi:hypothetical protein